MRDLQARSETGNFLAYGEMVGILWSQGQFLAAMLLEDYWNDVLRHTPFSLYCAYPTDIFSKSFQGCDVEAVAYTHTHVMPAQFFKKHCRIGSAVFADWCAVDILDDDGKGQWLAAHYVGSETESAAHANSKIVAPMVARGRTIGALTFVTRKTGRMYGQLDHELVEELARRAAIAVDNARLFAEARSERIRAEAANIELRRVNADLEQFAYSASHDLQEPLRVVSIYSQLLQRKFSKVLGPEGEEYLRYAIEGAVRIGKSGPRPSGLYKPINDRRATCKTHRCERRAQKCTVELRCRDNAGCRSDLLDALPRAAVHLKQLFQNLIGNAIQYRTHEAPLIHISAARFEAKRTFQVSDNGISWRPYLVESGPGRGSTFYFTIPNGL